MAKRTPESFAKRQKELARKEKQQKKAEKRLERKRLGGLQASGTEDGIGLEMQESAATEPDGAAAD